MDLVGRLVSFVMNTVPFFDGNLADNPMDKLFDIFLLALALGLISLFIKVISSIKQAGLFG